ncbi:hypothetical protein [Sphingobacterium bambusae]|uniref:Uncharacterized protein n=1 Tax=Sphingobacterium bambusae TaxID=662858 RepID=A0ABW6BIN8_9SPHI|nr:hypothetical protein [Sphingobacterium bambusae]WPL47498.1 hypothetical protein SCB77_16210 [Sphingobacterium bambusae]
MLLHTLPRVLIGLVGLLILAFQNLQANTGGGNSGMDIKLWLFIAVTILFLEGLYLLFEAFYLLYKTRYGLASINFAILVCGMAIFVLLARNN